MRPTLRVLWHESHATSAVLAAAGAAIPAAVVSAAVILLLDVADGRGATTTFGHLGLLLHLGVCLFWALVWGVLVAFTAHHIAPVAGALWGALYGVVIWFVTFYLLLPWTDPTLRASVPAWIGIPWHAAYGATLGVCFHFMRLHAERQNHRLPHGPAGVQ